VVGAAEVQGHIRDIADNPTVVGFGRDVEQLPGAQLDHSAVAERRRGRSGDDQPDVLDRASRLPNGRPDMLRPAPSRLIGRSPDGHPANAHELEPSLRHLAHFVGLVEPLEDHFRLYRHVFTPNREIER